MLFGFTSSSVAYTDAVAVGTPPPACLTIATTSPQFICFIIGFSSLFAFVDAHAVGIKPSSVAYTDAGRASSIAAYPLRDFTPPSVAYTDVGFASSLIFSDAIVVGLASSQIDAHAGIALPTS